MVKLISFSLVTLASFLAIPVAVFLAEVLAAIAPPLRNRLVSANQDSRRRVTVLVPAHNESTGLLPTLADIKAQMGSGDRLLVVADNCSDDTAAVAAAAGADVVDRHDPDRRGKGYALACGLRQLRMDPPDIVIIIDADCRLNDAAIDRLAATCAATHRPVQALDLMVAPNDSPINSRVAEFAWRVKNWVRPLGLRALGLPCQLMGTGMAVPWELIQSVDLASGLIVEDLKLGLDLALAGSPPVFCPSARVTSDFPSSVEGVQSQRRRWEQGHIAMILTAVPRLIFVAVGRLDFDLLALALDVAVPPLSLLGILVMGMSVVAGLATLLGFSSAAMFVSTASLVGFILGVFLSWLKWGRNILPHGAILLIASYVVRKIPLYYRVLCRKSGAQWIRTDRSKN
jgi:cellulose synthase/poly-beta-1,6-N-acetylglucosamine synthase-like glycosyltransferase